MKQYLKIALLALAALLLLTSCDDFNSKASYFDGQVLVEYQQFGGSNTSDCITITFESPGSYHVAFSQTPGGSDAARAGHGASVMPKDFDATFDAAPRVRVIAQPIIPDFLRVTITRGSVIETHDFQ